MRRRAGNRRFPWHVGPIPANLAVDIMGFWRTRVSFRRVEKEYEPILRMALQGARL